jgi:ADP-ribose pyrophosphatase YjhB (NUDIX family)
MNYCSHCSARLDVLIPEGDDRPRQVCPDCGRIHYVNPKLVVGSIPEWEGRVLLCKRAIEPRLGKWTLPAGFLEAGETVEAGARRETLEEAQGRLDQVEPYALFDLVFVNQIYLMFRARLVDGRFGIGEESLAVELFEERDVPWDQLAFTVMEKTLRRYFSDRQTGQFPFRIGTISPN